MKHPHEEELIAYHDGDAAQREAFGTHMKECAECKAELDRIDAVLAALDAMPIPDPGRFFHGCRKSARVGGDSVVHAAT
jgi:anti-sigma factor ChrR (cupin superfamily)